MSLNMVCTCFKCTCTEAVQTVLDYIALIKAYYFSEYLCLNPLGPFLLFVFRHQFPQPPTPLGKARIPAWQQSAPSPQPAHPELEQPGMASGQLILPVTETGTGKLFVEGRDGTDPLTAANGQGEGSDDAENTELNDQG